MNKKVARLRRARKTRAKIAGLGIERLSVYRSNNHIYAQIISAEGDKVLAQASTVETAVRGDLKSGSSVAAAQLVGKRVAFDRSGFKYHGRVKALADAARENGLSF